MHHRFKYWLVATIFVVGSTALAQGQEAGPTPAAQPRPEVARLIASGIESACKSEEKECPRIRQSYQRMFLSGFVSPGGTYGQQDWGTAAYTAGHQYRLAHLSDFSQAMADLGYPFVAGIEGRWTVGFETSAFTPARKFEGKWWVSGLEGMIRYVPDKQALDAGKRDRRIRISGYLNRACAEQLASGRKSTETPAGFPPGFGGYGHMGAYSCEIHATEIELLADTP